MWWRPQEAQTDRETEGEIRYWECWGAGGCESAHILVGGRKGDGLRQDLWKRQDGSAITDLIVNFRSSPTLTSRDSRGFRVPDEKAWGPSQYPHPHPVPNAKGN